ncbi:glycosyltransferase family 4 protein [Globicatella sanguinis]|uniref:glycosyltransferase family 4 protein n=1 Tax=Globicatella sanguinis TaxID=13076 RepID=UPI0008266F3C|nr:glycosyltransferase family 4 protein [Globicatella sanguinis]
MNIGLFTDTYFPQVSGVSTSIKSLRDELVKRGHFVIIFTTTDPHADDDEDGTIVRLPSIPFVSFEERRIAYSGFDKALRMARRFKLDVIHTHTEFSLGLTGLYVAGRLKIPAIHTYHTLYEKYTHYILDGDLIQAKHVGTLTRLFCEQVEGIIAPSTMTFEKLRDYGIQNEIRVIPTGVKIPEPNIEKVAGLKSKLAIASDEKVFLSLSRLSKEKSIDKVIDEYEFIAKEYPNSRLLIVGDGPAREELENQAAKKTARIDFIGEVSHDEVPNYYQLCDLYLNASESETQGLTYLEAFANCLPIIAKRNPYLESLMPQACFGQLFDDDVSLSQTAINFLKQMERGEIQTIDTKALSAISVETFGQSAEAFYEYAIQHKCRSRFNIPDIVIPRIKNLIRDVVLGPDKENGQEFTNN